MRILLFSGKGGVGKTSLSAATGTRLAELGYRTLVMSVDPAHSLADAFDLAAGLFDSKTAEPYPIADRLWIHEVNIQKEIKRNWHRIWSYISSLLRTSGLSEVEAEEMAIFPGMEELSALLYVNDWCKEKRYDVIVLDCAPTGESLRFVSMPTTMKWYMAHVFPIQRGLLRAVRPIANRVAPFELPPDSYFASVKDLFDRIEGIDELLENPRVTSVRLVTNAEKMVVRETQRAFVYFSLHGLTVDQVLVNRVLPEDVEDEFFREWRRTQKKFLEEIENYFAPVPVTTVPLFRQEVLGLERIRVLARNLRCERRSGGGDPDRASLFFPQAQRGLRGAAPGAVRGKKRGGAVQKGRRAGHRGRNGTPAYRVAELDERAVARACQAGRGTIGSGTAGGKMNNKNRKSQKEASGSCLCQGTGPVLSEIARRLAPPEAARGHFKTARLEFLKGLRALLDARIEQCSKPRSKGHKISVE